MAEKYTEVQWHGIEAGQWSAEEFMLRVDHAKTRIDDEGLGPLRAVIKDAKGDAKSNWRELLLDGIVARGTWPEYRDAFHDGRARALAENDVDDDLIRKVTPGY